MRYHWIQNTVAYWAWPFILVFRAIYKILGASKKITWNLVFSPNYASVCMSYILEWVLSNYTVHTEIYQIRLCVSQNHHLSGHTIFFSLEEYVSCVGTDNNMKYSDRFSKKTTRARCLEMWSVTHNSWLSFNLKKN